jgi:hypothetical protein
MRACDTPQSSNRRDLNDVAHRLVPSPLQSAKMGLDEGKRQQRRYEFP